MKYAANLLILIGFCLGTLGATGFHNPALSANAPKLEAGYAVEVIEGSSDEAPNREEHAMLMFLIGLGVLIGGGFMTKFANGSTGLAAEDHHAQDAALVGQLLAIESSLRELHGKAADMVSADLHQAISDMSEGPIYEVTSEFEHWTAILGFDRYSQVWTGVAAGERLVNRAWSMETDGHAKEAIEELKFAADAFAEAQEQLKG
jgi:hypothetical protein